jgi:pSer/pThr/pTyr-binding forkhead associated (FHA) protein
MGEITSMVKVTPDPEAHIETLKGKRKTPATGMLSRRNILSDAAYDRLATSELEQIELDDEREIILMIRGIAERLTLTPNFSVVLGRSDPNYRQSPDIDLLPYGAMRRGVSRQHARMLVVNNGLYLVDLASTNGTYVNGKRLDPHMACKVKRGDEVMLGHMLIQLLFSDPLFGKEDETQPYRPETLEVEAVQTKEAETQETEQSDEKDLTDTQKSRRRFTFPKVP